MVSMIPHSPSFSFIFYLLYSVSFTTWSRNISIHKALLPFSSIIIPWVMFLFYTQMTDKIIVSVQILLQELMTLLPNLVCSLSLSPSIPPCPWKRHYYLFSFTSQTLRIVLYPSPFLISHTHWLPTPAANSKAASFSTHHISPSLLPQW